MLSLFSFILLQIPGRLPFQRLISYNAKDNGIIHLFTFFKTHEHKLDFTSLFFLLFFFVLVTDQKHLFYVKETANMMYQQENTMYVCIFACVCVLEKASWMAKACYKLLSIFPQFSFSSISPASERIVALCRVHKNHTFDFFFFSQMKSLTLITQPRSVCSSNQNSVS